MEFVDLTGLLAQNPYPGRGIVLGRSDCGRYAVAAYFIMGRSENSRNRVFVEQGTGIRTQPFDPARVKDPSLIIYAPVRVLGAATIVTNGDQTDTIYDALSAGGTFEGALRTRAFEPDAPNYTPRVSGMVTLDGAGGFAYRLAVLKSDNGRPEACLRQFFEYEAPAAGQGRFLHTYTGDGAPLPSFEGEPEAVTLSGDIDTFTQRVWNALNADNKVSLFVRYIDLATGKWETRIVNKHN